MYRNKFRHSLWSLVELNVLVSCCCFWVLLHCCRCLLPFFNGNDDNMDIIQSIDLLQFIIFHCLGISFIFLWLLHQHHLLLSSFYSWSICRISTLNTLSILSFHYIKPFYWIYFCTSRFTILSLMSQSCIRYAYIYF